MPLVVIAPLVGMAIVPVTLPVGAGLTPSDVISVESVGIPAGPTWANAGPQHNKGQAAVTINNGLMERFPDKSGRITRRAAASTAVGEAAGTTTFFFIAAHTG